MNIEITLKECLAKGLTHLFGTDTNPSDLTLQATKKEFEGTFTFTTFAITKLSKLSPEEAGKQLGEFLLADSNVVSSFNVVKGFLNLVISTEAWMLVYTETLSKDTFGFFPPNGKKVMVEYSSPNTNKPLHLGHLRNNFLGYSVAEFLKANGYNVIKANLINDRGIHICKSMLAYQKFGNGETPESTGLKGDHLVGKYYVAFDKYLKEEAGKLLEKGIAEEQIEKQNPALLEAQELLLKWEQGNQEVFHLWKTMNDWVYKGFNATYEKIGVNFDKFYYESNTYLLGKSIVDEGLTSGVFFKKENGAVWIDLTSDGLDEKLVLRADGTSVYITQDLGTADLKYEEFGCEKSIYVVGNEQDYHFNVLKLVLAKLSKPYAPGVYHLSYGMVDLPSGKMKSREGTVVDADDLIEEMIGQAKSETEAHNKHEDFTVEDANNLYRQLGLGALKYYLLRVDPKKRMMFIPEESIQLNGDTGPYIQYTYARSRAIIRRATQQEIPFDISEIKGYNALNASEIRLLTVLNKYPTAIKEAAEQYSPALLAQYAIELAREFNRFYTEVPILSEEDLTAKKMRISLTDTSGKTIKKVMLLLGIEVPERM